MLLITSLVYFYQFMVRQQVLKLYKDILNAIKRVPDEANRKDLMNWARSDFKQNKAHSDEVILNLYKPFIFNR